VDAIRYDAGDEVGVETQIGCQDNQPSAGAQNTPDLAESRLWFWKMFNHPAHDAQPETVILEREALSAEDYRGR